MSVSGVTSREGSLSVKGEVGSWGVLEECEVCEDVDADNMYWGKKNLVYRRSTAANKPSRVSALRHLVGLLGWQGKRGGLACLLPGSLSRGGEGCLEIGFALGYPGLTFWCKCKESR